VAEGELMPLTPHQARRVDTVLRGFARGEKQQVLAGAAGTGKTFCMKKVAELWSGSEVILAAPTNKAALRLRDLTELDACTIHSMAYQRPVTEEGTGALRGFVQREDGSLEIADDALIVCDEASMLDRWLYQRLVAALPDGTRILLVGDWAQLPPPRGAPAVDLEHPDAMLTEVHRQAADSSILRWATHIREHRVPLTRRLVESWGLDVPHVGLRQVGEALLPGRWRVAIGYTNQTRWRINEAARAALLQPPLAEGPKVGDRVIATTTCQHLGIPNGERGEVVLVNQGRPIEGEATWWVVVRWPGGKEEGVVVPVESWCPPGAEPWKPESSTAPVSRIREKAPVEATLKLIGLQAAWALTTHKMQGDQAANGIVILESAAKRDKHGWKLGYTQVTRFEKEIRFATIPLPAATRRARARNRRRFL
jgi:exodeoxyribonuclease V